MQLVIVTGMSGAGKSRVIDNLEDIGFFCVDNMTPKLIPTFVQLLKDSSEEREKVAIVADIRLGGSFSHLFNAIEELKNIDCNVKILFIDADNDWTALTEDGYPSAQWEYTVLITEDGAEILTY